VRWALRLRLLERKGPQRGSLATGRRASVGKGVLYRGAPDKSILHKGVLEKLASQRKRRTSMLHLHLQDSITRLLNMLSKPVMEFCTYRAAVCSRGSAPKGLQARLH